jgi:hypothetical protein
MRISDLASAWLMQNQTSSQNGWLSRNPDPRSYVATDGHQEPPIQNVRVPAVYFAWAFLWVFHRLEFHKISNLRPITSPEGFDSHPGRHFFTTIKNRVHLKKSHLFTKITLASGLQFKLHLVLVGRAWNGRLWVLN